MTMTDSDSWKAALRTFLASSVAARTSGIPVLMPEYRPDICRTIAWESKAEFFDFRAEVMRERGMQAHGITLDELDDVLAHRASAGSLVAFNIESLLATKSGEARRRWLERFSQKIWRHQVLLPLSIYQNDAFRLDVVLDLRDHEFEPQSLISRLAM
jgi:hypothetical protein